MGIAVLIAIVVIMLATFLLGCTENPDNMPNDEMNNGEYIFDTAIVENVEILILESFPVQVNAVIKGYLPDGCTEIDKSSIKTDLRDNTFEINIKTKRPMDMICTEAIVPFEQVIALDVYGLDKGNYTVRVNEIEGDFELAVDNVISD
jgi:inhibitor of cysteine peptidase